MSVTHSVSQLDNGQAWWWPKQKKKPLNFFFIKIIIQKLNQSINWLDFLLLLFIRGKQMKKNHFFTDDEIFVHRSWILFWDFSFSVSRDSFFFVFIGNSSTSQLLAYDTYTHTHIDILDCRRQKKKKEYSLKFSIYFQYTHTNKHKHIVAVVKKQKKIYFNLVNVLCVTAHAYFMIRNNHLFIFLRKKWKWKKIK